MPADANDVKAELAAHATEERAKTNAWFFKTDPGEYGEGDEFIGVKVPDVRRVVKQFRDLPLPQCAELLASGIHEHRLCALLILVEQFNRGDDAKRKTVFDFYVKHIDRVNNWDLVDSSAPQIVGNFLATRSRSKLHEWARSKSLWRRRIAIMATLAFIKREEFGETISIAGTLLEDSHDLIHKAVGWMIREIGNRDRDVMERFLEITYERMPRTMLRYAIEKLPEPRRQDYLQGRV